MSVTAPTSDQSDERTGLLGTYSSGVVAYSGRHPRGADIERVANDANSTALRRGLSARQVQMIAIGESAGLRATQLTLSEPLPCRSGYHWNRLLFIVYM
jgi:hypothetical protein